MQNLNKDINWKELNNVSTKWRKVKLKSVCVVNIKKQSGSYECSYNKLISAATDSSWIDYAYSAASELSSLQESLVDVSANRSSFDYFLSMSYERATTSDMWARLMKSSGKTQHCMCFARLRRGKQVPPTKVGPSYMHFVPSRLKCHDN